MVPFSLHYSWHTTVCTVVLSTQLGMHQPWWRSLMNAKSQEREICHPKSTRTHRVTVIPQSLSRRYFRNKRHSKGDRKEPKSEKWKLESKKKEWRRFKLWLSSQNSGRAMTEATSNCLTQLKTLHTGKYHWLQHLPYTQTDTCAIP